MNRSNIFAHFLVLILPKSDIPAAQCVSRLGPEHFPGEMLTIAVFGPGKGEAIIVRLPDGTTGVVDGCKEPTTPQSGKGDPIRETLKRLGNPNLGFVCLTHPHSDHYAGLGRLLEHYPGTIDAIWKAPGSSRYIRALLELLKAEELPGFRGSQDVKGLERVIHQIKARRDNIPILTALAHRPLYQSPAQDGPTIWSCGPSDNDIDRAEEAIVANLRRLLDGNRANDPVDVNLTSSALLIRWREAGVLLAGDLLCPKGSNWGWRVAHPTIGTAPVQVVNVAHHASEEAHDDVLWAMMDPTLAIVTPFLNASEDYPPRPSMIRTLMASSHVAITFPPKWTDDEGVHPIEPEIPMIPPASRTSGLPIAPTIPVTPLDIDPNHSAVAVSLDAEGNIRSITLSGNASFYQSPD